MSTHNRSGWLIQASQYVAVQTIPVLRPGISAKDLALERKKWRGV